MKAAARECRSSGLFLDCVTAASVSAHPHHLEWRASRARDQGRVRDLPYCRFQRDPLSMVECAWDAPVRSPPLAPAPWRKEPTVTIGRERASTVTGADTRTRWPPRSSHPRPGDDRAVLRVDVLVSGETLWASNDLRFLDEMTTRQSLSAAGCALAGRSWT